MQSAHQAPHNLQRHVDALDQVHIHAGPAHTHTGSHVTRQWQLHSCVGAQQGCQCSDNLSGLCSNAQLLAICQCDVWQEFDQEGGEVAGDEVAAVLQQQQPAGMFAGKVAGRVAGKGAEQKQWW